MSLLRRKNEGNVCDKSFSFLITHFQSHLIYDEWYVSDELGENMERGGSSVSVV
jgi:hypothetical protein